MSVTNGNDSGPGSLRDEIVSGVSPTIVIDPSVSTITLDIALLIERDVTIVASHNPTITISDTFVQTFMIQVLGTYTVSFEGIWFTRNINVATCLAIQTSGSETLGLFNCRFTQWADTPDTGVRGVVNSRGNLVINGCTFTNNNVRAVVNAGKILAGTWSNTIANSEFTNNSTIRGVLSFNVSMAGTTQTINLSGLNIMGNYTSTGDPSVFGGTVYAPFSTPDTDTIFSMTDSVVSNNTSDPAVAGIYLGATTMSSVNLERVRVENNNSLSGNLGQHTAGLFFHVFEVAGVENSRTVNIDACTFANNASVISAGIRVNNVVTETAMTIESTTISGNTVSSLTPTAFFGSGITFTGSDIQLTASNTTFANNSSINTTINLGKTSGDPDIFRNVTVTGNTNPNGALRIPFTGVEPILHNCLFTENYTDSSATTRVDINGPVSTTSSCNLVSVDSLLLGISDGINGNQIGTIAAPIDAMIGSLGNYGGINNVEVVPLLLGSPAINAGNNAQAFGAYDQRGLPYVRIYDGVVDIGAFEYQPFAVPCYLGKSLVKVKEDGVTKYIKAKHVRANKHRVYDVGRRRFIPILYNAKIRGAETIYKIPAGSVGRNVPHEDLYITSGHPVFINGKAVKARDVPSSVKTPLDKKTVYSIVCDKWCPIDVNGLGVFAWSEKKWLAHVRKEGIVFEKL